MKLCKGGKYTSRTMEALASAFGAPYEEKWTWNEKRQRNIRTVHCGALWSHSNKGLAVQILNLLPDVGVNGWQDMLRTATDSRGFLMFED